MPYDYASLLGFGRGPQEAPARPNRAQRRAAVKRVKAARQLAARKGGK